MGYLLQWLSLHPKIVLFFDLEDTFQPEEQRKSNELIRQLSQEGVLVITVSPNLDFLEKISDRMIYCHAGPVPYSSGSSADM